MKPIKSDEVKEFFAKGLVSLAALAFLMGSGTALSFAEEASSAAAQGAYQGLAQEAVSAQAIREKVAQWRKLKQENPEEFARLLAARKGEIKERLQTLKTENPERFQELRGKIQHHRYGKLRKLYNQNPARFREFMKNHPHLAERWRKHRQTFDAYRRDRFEDRRDKREDVRDRLEDVRDRREDLWDARHDGGIRDRIEDRWDRREDRRDKREDYRDVREDHRDWRQGPPGLPRDFAPLGGSRDRVFDRPRVQDKARTGALRGNRGGGGHRGGGDRGGRR